MSRWDLWILITTTTEPAATFLLKTHGYINNTTPIKLFRTAEIEVAIVKFTCRKTNTFVPLRIPTIWIKKWVLEKETSIRERTRLDWLIQGWSIKTRRVDVALKKQKRGQTDKPNSIWKSESLSTVHHRRTHFPLAEAHKTYMKRKLRRRACADKRKTNKSTKITRIRAWFALKHFVPRYSSVRFKARTKKYRRILSATR